MTRYVATTAVICVMLLGSNLNAQESQSYSFNYDEHFQGSDPNNPSITRYATGTLTVTRPAVGTNLATTPFVASATVQMEATRTVVPSEWSMANNSRTVYSFARRTNGSAWSTTDQFRPDSFTPHAPGSGQTGRWSWSEQVSLGPTSEQDHLIEIDMYVSCCRCNPDLQIPPPRGMATMRVSIEIRWRTDAGGVVTQSSFSGFQFEQCNNLYGGSPRYAVRRDGGHACSQFELTPAKGPKSPFTNPENGGSVAVGDTALSCVPCCQCQCCQCQCCRHHRCRRPVCWGHRRR